MDRLINSLCDVVFLCGEIEPSWVGLISLGVGIVLGAYFILEQIVKYISSKI